MNEDKTSKYKCAQQLQIEMAMGVHVVLEKLEHQ